MIGIRLGGLGFRSAMVNPAMTTVEEFMMMMLEVLWYRKSEMWTRVTWSSEGLGVILAEKSRCEGEV